MSYTGTELGMGRFTLINKLAELKELADKWDVKEFSFDTEFTSLNWYEQRLIGMSIYSKKSRFDPIFIQFNFWDTYIVKESNPAGGRKKIDVEYRYEKSDAIDWEDAKPYIYKIFQDAKCTCASAKVEYKIFRKYGIDNWEIQHDVNLMSWLLNVDTPNDLKWNTTTELGVKMPSYEETIKQKPGNINWNLVDWYEYAEYGARDAWATENLKHVFYPRISEFLALKQCYEELEIPLLPEVGNSEMAGVNIDVPFLQGLSVIADKEIKILEQEIFDKVGVEFNISSTKQLAEILFDRLGYPVLSVSDKTGARSTNEDTLKELAFRGHDVADDILDYRKFVKLKNTYMDSLPSKLDPDGMLRGNLNQTGTATGRFSSSNPNLQNIPNDKRFPIKAGFIPRPGYKFLVYDWSTIEIRIMAHESNDQTMIKMLQEGFDVHQGTTDSINEQYGTSLDRGQGKTINFAVLYLMGKQSLAYTLNKDLKKRLKNGDITMEEFREAHVSENMAQQIIDGFFSNYYGFAQYVQDITENVRETGWVWTLGGRRRPVPELKNKKTYGFGRRKACNCVDENTECFSKKAGWITYKELTEGDEILTFNNTTNKMEWNKVDILLIKKHTGKMLKMSGENHDSLTTLDHRWFTRDSVSGLCRTETSNELTRYGRTSSRRIPLMQEWADKKDSIYTEDQFKLMGIFMTDGNYESSKRIAITQSTSKRKTGNLEEIERLVSATGCKIEKRYIKESDKYADIHQIEISGEFVQTIITLLDDEKLFKSKDFIYSLSQRDARALLDGLLLGDGWMKKRSIKTKYISTKVFNRRKDFEDIVLMAGYGYSTTFNKASEQWVICIKSRRNAYLGLMEKEIEVDYSGDVWCPHVDNDSFLARRNGHIYVTQNTPIQGGAGDLMKKCIVELAKMYKEFGFDAKTLLYIHDEYVIEVLESQAEKCAEQVKKLMENIFPACTVPLKCEGGIFDNWNGLKGGAKPSKALQRRVASAVNDIRIKKILKMI